MTRTAVIVGAGPAGLTAAHELLARSDIRPIVLEADAQVGGISKTVVYRGNRMDLGGHRFFSKSDWVMQWWQSILPIAQSQTPACGPLALAYQGQTRQWRPPASTDAQDERVMLVRSRLSRILYRRRFFDYPLKLSWATLRNLGPAYTAQIAASYGLAKLAPRKPEVTLEDFLVNRFGEKLHRTFFKDYTEKVWGVPCTEIAAEWGAQRIKSLSISSAIRHALSKPFRRTDERQRGVETSLIERFLYPQLGPGQMWEEVARRITRAGAELHLGTRVVGLQRRGERIWAVDVRDHLGQTRRIPCDCLVSTMPISELCRYLEPSEERVARVAQALPYRDFLTVGLLLRRMRPGPGEEASSERRCPPDNWIYIQEPDVKLGRLQIFNNWSPALVADPFTVWVGLEYFCAEGDGIWSMRDPALVEFAAAELETLGLIDRRDVLDGTVVRVPRAYPAYFGEYRDIGIVRAFLDGFPNLFPVGRNGMHRYNNQDHSMLAARAAVDCIVGQSADKSSIWAINAEQQYQEEVGEQDRRVA